MLQVCDQLSIGKVVRARADIVAELRSVLAALWKRKGRHALVTGHAAGGHLTAAMLATGSQVAGVPTDLVRRGVAISGGRPAAACWHQPQRGPGPRRGQCACGKPGVLATATHRPHLVAAAGGAESAQFLRQSRDIAARKSAGVGCQYLEIPGTNHFTVLDRLVHPNSTLPGKIAALARA
jgi:arylformamidase